MTSLSPDQDLLGPYDQLIEDEFTRNKRLAAKWGPLPGDPTERERERERERELTNRCEQMMLMGVTERFLLMDVFDNRA